MKWQAKNSCPTVARQHGSRSCREASPWHFNSADTAAKRTKATTEYRERRGREESHLLRSPTASPPPPPPSPLDAPASLGEFAWISNEARDAHLCLAEIPPCLSYIYPCPSICPNPFDPLCAAQIVIDRPRASASDGPNAAWRGVRPQRIVGDRRRGQDQRWGWCVRYPTEECADGASASMEGMFAFASSLIA